jgi:hypothetical protein
MPPFMNTLRAGLLCSLALAFANALAFADQPDEPRDHFFTVPSPHNKFHVVHTVRSWKNVPNQSQFGRIQVFNTETGREAWRLEGALFEKCGTFPSDDGEHLVLLMCRLRGVGAEVKRNEPVLFFYERDRLVKSYSLEQLKIESAKLPHSVSHSEFYQYREMLNGWHWEWPPGSREFEIEIRQMSEPNPYWQDGVLELKTNDGQKFRFDPATGAMLPDKRK